MTLRARRRRARLLWSVCLLVACGGAAYGVHALSYIPQFSVQTIQISGARDVSSTLVEAYVEGKLSSSSSSFISPRNIFFYPRGALQAAVASAFPRIKSVAISRQSLLATAITVSIDERRPYAQWCSSGGECFSMDESGYVFAPTATSTVFATPYTFAGDDSTSSPIGRTFARGEFPEMLAFIKNLAHAGFTSSGATITSDTDYRVTLSDGYYLKASFGEDPDQLVKNLQLILKADALRGKATELDYVDLRFGNRVYYKLSGQPQSQ